MSMTRKLVKLILTLLTLPLLVVVWLLKWFVTFLHCCSAWTTTQTNEFRRAWMKFGKSTDYQSKRKNKGERNGKWHRYIPRALQSF